MGVAIKIIGFQIWPYLGQVTINEEGGGEEGKDIPLVGLSISGSNTIPTNTSSVQLSVVYNPYNTTQKGVNWTSSNSSAASVDSTGLVTVVNRPSNNDTTVIITATSSQNSSIKATYPVVISASSQQPPAQKYVTEGLVQYYDAIDNQGLNKERASGTVKVGSTWVDIIDGNSMGISASSIRDNVGQFDAKSYNLLAFNNAKNTGFVSAYDWPFPDTVAGDFTIECVMTTPSTFIDGHTGFTSGYSETEPKRYRFQIGITPDGNIKLNYRTVNGSWQQAYFTYDSAMKPSTFYNLAIVRKSGVMTAYLNGEQAGSPVNFDKEIFTVIDSGVWSIADNGQPAAYHAYRFYNRALTQNELTQNTNYDISRYK